MNYGNNSNKYTKSSQIQNSRINMFLTVLSIIIIVSLSVVLNECYFSFDGFEQTDKQPKNYTKTTKVTDNNQESVKNNNTSDNIEVADNSEKETESKINSEQRTNKDIKTEKYIIPCFKTLDEQYIYPLSMVNIRRIDPKTNTSTYLQIKNNPGFVNIEYPVREYTNFPGTDKNFTAKTTTDAPGFQLYYSDNSLASQDLIWEVKIENNTLLFVRYDKNDRYEIKLAGNVYYVYKNGNRLFAQLETNSSKDTLVLEKFGSPSQLVYLGYYDFNIEKEKQLIYSPAVILFDDLDIDIMQILLLETLRLENKHKLKDILSKSKYELPQKAYGIVRIDDNYCRISYDNSFGEYFHSFYTISSDTKNLFKAVHTMTLNDDTRTYASVDLSKKRSLLDISFKSLADGFELRNLNNEYLGRFIFKDGNVIYSNNNGQIKYKFEIEDEKIYTASDNKQTEQRTRKTIKIDNVIDKENIGNVIADRNTDKGNYRCIIQENIGNNEYKAYGYFVSIEIPDSYNNYVAISPSVFLFNEYNEDIRYCIFNECLLYSLNHPNQ